MVPRYSRLTDSQWQNIKPFLNTQRKRKYNLRFIVDALLWITRTGCQWRNLESSFPPWKTVYYYFEKWSKQGTLEKINQQLNCLEREEKDRARKPSLGVADSQSVKLLPMICESRGIDGNKFINGRKRHLLTCTLGRIWKVHVHAANQHDSPAGVNLLNWEKEEMKSLKKIVADKAYRGTFAEEVEARDIKFEVPKRSKDQKGFVVEAKRWVVERTFAWLNFYRRVVMDYEKTPRSAKNFLYLANISMVLSVL